MLINNPDADKPKVLLVEDEPISQRVAQIMLEELGCIVNVADNGTSALSLFKQHQYDIIFMDLGLPDVTGDQVAFKIRELESGKQSRVIIIALTAHVFHSDEKKCLAAGMDGFLCKPIEQTKLQLVLSDWLVH